MTKLVVLATVAMSLMACGAPASPTAASTPSAPAASTTGTCTHATIVLVRHGEKASSDPDTELSNAGHERAKRIATILGSSGVARLVATDVKRTQQTLAPLSEKLGKPVEVRAARDTDALIRELAATPAGSVVVVAHHSNGIPRITRAFGVEPRGVTPSDDALPEKDFSRMIVLTLDCDRAHATAIELSSD